MFRSILLTLCATLAPFAAAAQNQRISHCIAIADAAPGIEYLHKANWSDPVPEQSVRLHYIDHSMVLLQTEGGLSVVTDFNGWTGGARFAPDYVTMNHARRMHVSQAAADGDADVAAVQRGERLAAQHGVQVGLEELRDEVHVLPIGSRERGRRAQVEQVQHTGVLQCAQQPDLAQQPLAVE